MKRTLIRFTSWTLLFLFILAALVSLVHKNVQLVYAYTSPGSPTGYVNDFAGILSQDVKNSLEEELTNFKESSSTEIVIATVNSLDGDDVASYGNALFREWGVGTKASNNGVLLLIAPNERKLRIEVGYGLEGALTDIQSGRIIDEIITPEFKNGNYDEGVTQGVYAIEAAVQGEEFTASATSSQSENYGWLYNHAGFLFFAGIIALQWLTSILAKSKSWWLGGVFGGAIGVIIGFFFGFFFVGTISIVILSIFGLIFDYIVSKGYKASKGGKSIPWFIGGGGGSSGGGGFGGFSGGSSGGGGASGSW